MRTFSVCVGLSALSTGVALDIYEPWAWIAVGSVILLAATLWRHKGPPTPLRGPDMREN